MCDLLRALVHWERTSSFSIAIQAYASSIRAVSFLVTHWFPI